MDGASLFLGLAGCAFLTLSLFGDEGDRGDALTISLIIVLSWGVTGLLWNGANLDQLAFLDGCIAAIGCAIARDRGSVWARMFAWMAVTQLLLDMAYSVIGSSFYLWYQGPYNAAFIGECLAVGSTGAGNVGHGWLRRFRSLRILLAQRATTR